jgi:hypothetical protein
VKPIRFVDFCTNVLRLVLSLGWLVLLLVAVDGVEPRDLDGEKREMARLLFGDVDEIPPAARRALVWRLGRGSGKTTIAAALGVWIKLTARLDAIGPGMVPAVVTVAPSKATAKLSVGVARELVRRVSSLERLVTDDGDTADGFSLRRPDGRRVSFVAVAASRGGTTLRGYDILALILDESEFLSSNADVASADGYAINDRDLYAAAKPRLHGPAIFISTPWPVDNLTAELFDKNHGRPTTALAAIGASTLMRPNDERLARDVAQALTSGDDEDARREYLCEPGARGGSRLFDSASIDAAIVEGRPVAIEAHEGADAACGGDLGLERDSSAIAVVSNVGGTCALLEFDEVRPGKSEPLSPGYVIESRFAPIMRRHRVASITMDGHYRQSAIEHLEAVNLGFEEAPEGNQGKYDSYMHVRSLLRTGKLKIPAAPRLVAQLRAVTSTPLPGGGTRITSPRRMGAGHGDIVSALVLACWAARSVTPPWVRAMSVIENRGGRIFPSAPTTWDDVSVQESRDLFGETVSLEIAGVAGRAVFEYGDREPRFSVSVVNDEAFKTKVRNWWKNRYGDGPAVRKVW